MNKKIDGTFFEFLHHNTAEGKYWSPALKKFTGENWREKIREISDEMAENEAKIKELTERNENLSSRLSEAETAKLALIEKRATLEEEAKKETSN